MNNNAAFKLQEITIILDKPLATLEDEGSLSQRIGQAMETYHWLYKDEKNHDVMVKVLIPMKYKRITND